MVKYASDTEQKLTVKGECEGGRSAKEIRAARPPLSLDLRAEECGLGATLAFCHRVISAQVLVTIGGDPHMPLLKIVVLKIV